MSAVSLGASVADARAAGLERPDRGAAAADWSGLWYKMIEETRGEFVGMRGGKRRPDGSIAWSFLSHATYDGVGGFVHLLRQDHGATHVEVPARKSRPPSLMARAAALLRLVAKKPEPAAACKNMDLSAQVKSARPGTWFATELFDRECTQRLTRKARALGVPLNSLLLAALGRASESELYAGPARWIMPVNMRGPVALANDTANQTGYLHIELPADSTPSQAHEQMKLALRRREHWATWLFLKRRPDRRIPGYLRDLPDADVSVRGTPLHRRLHQSGRLGWPRRVVCVPARRGDLSGQRRRHCVQRPAVADNRGASLHGRRRCVGAGADDLLDCRARGVTKARVRTVRGDWLAVGDGKLSAHMRSQEGPHGRGAHCRARAAQEWPGHQQDRQDLAGRTGSVISALAAALMPCSNSVHSPENCHSIAPIGVEVSTPWR